MVDFPHRCCHTCSVTDEPLHSHNSFYYPQILYITALKIISSITHRHFSTFLLLFYLLCHFENCSQNIQERKCTYKRNSEAHSRNHGCRAKSRGITYSECVCLFVCLCVSVALVVQNAKRMRCVISLSVSCPVPRHFFHFIS
jgi:hypothetical protein